VRTNVCASLCGTVTCPQPLFSTKSSDELDFIVFMLLSCAFHSLDPEQKDILIEVIEKLLADKTTVVILWNVYIT